MLFRHPKADLFVPDQCDPAQAFARVTHLGIVSHQDDLEIAAYHGITDCFRSESKWFGGVVVTNGAHARLPRPAGNVTLHLLRMFHLDVVAPRSQAVVRFASMLQMPAQTHGTSSAAGEDAGHASISRSPATP